MRYCLVKTVLQNNTTLFRYNKIKTTLICEKSSEIVEKIQVSYLDGGEVDYKN